MVEMLSIAGGLIEIAAFYFYFRSVAANTSTPNIATWLIWLVIFLMNTITYFMVARGNWWQSLVTIVAAGGVFFIFLYSLFRGKFAKVGAMEITCLTAALIIGIVWKTTEDAVLANLLLQFIYVISFLPMIIGLARGTLRERVLPWALAFSAYVPTIIIIIINWSSSDWVGLVHPIVNGVMGNGAIILLVLLKKRRCPCDRPHRGSTTRAENHSLASW
jgi:hypothetical protein